MALPTVDVEYTMTAGGSSTNGGLWIRGSSGVDFSMQDTPELEITDLVIVGTGTCSSVLTPFTSDHVGNSIYIVSGSGFTTGRFHIQSVDGGGVATLDRNLGTTSSTGGVANVGGGLTINMADSFYEALPDTSRLYFMANGVHTMTANLAIAADGTTATPMYWFGFKTTKGDGWGVPANRPTIACGAYNINLDNYYRIHHLDFTTSSTTRCIRLDTESRIFECKATSTAVSGIPEMFDMRATFGRIESCDAVLNGFGTGFHIDGTYAWVVDGRVDNAAYGVYFNDPGTYVRGNIFSDCTAGVYGGTNFDSAIITKNIFYNCTKGVHMDSTGSLSVRVDDCIFHTCITGIERVTSEDYTSLFYHNNFFNCTTDTTNADNQFDKTTTDPDFTDAPNGDFSVGAAMDGTGYPAKIGDTTTHFSQGAIAYRNTGGGGGSDKIGKLIGNAGGLIG